MVSGVLIGGTLLHGLGQEATTKIIKDFVSIACIEFLLIDAGIQLVKFTKELCWNDLYCHLAKELLC